MSKLSQFVLGAAGRSPTSIVNGFSAGGVSMATQYLDAFAKIILSGALVAGTYKELLSVTGAGVLSLCAGFTADTTTRTVGLKLVIDGETVFDAVTGNISIASVGIPVVGWFPGATVSATRGMELFVPFHSSLAISLKSSLNETDKLKLAVLYRLV